MALTTETGVHVQRSGLRTSAWTTTRRKRSGFMPSGSIDAISGILASILAMIGCSSRTATAVSGGGISGLLLHGDSQRAQTRLRHGEKRLDGVEVDRLIT